MHPGMCSAPVPPAGPFWAKCFEEDDRVLPVPQPHDKHGPPVSRAQRYHDARTWRSWKVWLRECWDRQWSKGPIHDALAKRSQAAQGIAWSRASDLFDEEGLIFMLYHFPSAPQQYCGNRGGRAFLTGSGHHGGWGGPKILELPPSDPKIIPPAEWLWSIKIRVIVLTVLILIILTAIWLQKQLI